MGRKPIYPQKYNNYGHMDTHRTTVKCKYYQGNNNDFITDRNDIIFDIQYTQGY